jgi:hypothetical protein
MATFWQQKNINNFPCVSCDFICSKKGDFNRHLKTKKHLATIWQQKNIKPYFNFENICLTDSTAIPILNATQNKTQNLHQITSNYIAPNIVCECGKTYKDRTGLWKHKKTCSLQQHNEESQMCSMFIESVKQNQAILLQNQEFQMKMFEFMKDSGGVINSNNTITTNNNKFNLNFFLNETCKDAMNLSEFVDSLKITLSDLENVGKLGYAEGISRIFTKGLKELEVHKRPIHCSDLKRETVYIKNENKWEKESNHLKKAIKQITNKNIRLIPKWKAENPGHQEYHNKKNDEYLKIMYESMGPTDDIEETKTFARIITNLAKETIILKTSDSL